MHVPLLSGSLSSPDNMMWVSTHRPDSEKLLPLFCGPEFDRDDVPPMIPLKANTVGKISLFSSQYDEAVYDEVIDRLNQVYVALYTRIPRADCRISGGGVGDFRQTWRPHSLK